MSENLPLNGQRIYAPWIIAIVATVCFWIFAPTVPRETSAWDWFYYPVSALFVAWVVATCIVYHFTKVRDWLNDHIWISMSLGLSVAFIEGSLVLVRNLRAGPLNTPLVVGSAVMSLASIFLIFVIPVATGRVAYIVYQSIPVMLRHAWVRRIIYFFG